jgi:hypothetical protein
MGVFDDVRAVFRTDPRRWAQDFGLRAFRNRPSISGGWLGKILCPYCEDQSGSASVAIDSGHLKCFQCAKSVELFSWVADLQGIKVDGKHGPLMAAKYAAGVMGIPLDEKRKKLRQIKRATPKIVEECRKALANREDPASAAFLRGRNFDPEGIARLGAGVFGDGVIAFWMHDEQTGHLRPRYRAYRAKDKKKWWSAARDEDRVLEPDRISPNGFWPMNDVPADRDDAVILICEGEWDAAAIRLQVPEEGRRGIYAFAWTGGALAKPPHAVIPQAWYRKEVWIAWDLDQFQNPDITKCSGPSLASVRRQLDPEESSLLGWAQLLESSGCRVRIVGVPLDPVDFPKGDLRDWVAQGGTDVWSLPRWTPDEVWRDQPCVEVEIEDIAKMEDGDRVLVRGQVHSEYLEVQVVPEETLIDCELGNAEFANLCRRCGVPDRWPERRILWADHQRMLFSAYTSRDPERAIHQLIRKPSGCNSCVLEHTRSAPAKRWTLMDEDDGQQVVEVLGGSPNYASRLKVRGTVYTRKDGRGKGVKASQVVEIDSTTIEVPEEQRKALHGLVPPRDASPRQIDEFLARRYEDIGTNLTHVYGRPEFHLAIDLVMHSPLFLHIEEKRVRGFLDCCVFGDTRGGKTATIAGYMQAVGLGKVVTSMGTISRAGLIVSNRDGVMRPGLWPRHHGRAIMLDEFHALPKSDSAGKSLIVELQKARDSGTIDTTKDSGSYTLPAAVRLVSVANWWKDRASRPLPINHLAGLYQDIPQVISRLDFAWCYQDDGQGIPKKRQVEHLWTVDRLRTTILRAWAQREGRVIFGEGTLEMARSYCERWSTKYDMEEIPLFTGIEKIYSILRIATAVANICFSVHEHVHTVWVGKNHVEWAATFLEKTWKNLGYEQWSQAIDRREAIVREHEACRDLFAVMPTSDDGLALEFLRSEQNIMDAISPFEWQTPMEGRQWIARLVRNHVFKLRGGSLVCPTKGGQKLIERLLHWAYNEPEKYNEYAEQVRIWFRAANDRDPSLSSSQPRSLVDDVGWAELNG